eukprot:GDKJ01019951.1.p1 GENE.GDKJ01019951.1~~GDKJ01019951.1.p1  ORF type:complete len:241 (+),score=74.23 GDKJ01019951.1:26-748(+)
MVKGKVIQIDAKAATNLSSNWKTMLEKKVIPTSDRTLGKTMLGVKPSLKKFEESSRCAVAIDCEMVGVKNKAGEESDALARIAIIDENNIVLMDDYVKPTDFITDYRFEITGIKFGHIKNAKTLPEILPTIQKHLANRTVVGHAIHNDLRVLGFSIPQDHIRDTSRYIGLRLENAGKVMALKKLAAHWLDETSFQEGVHDPVEDAKMAMRLYKLKRGEWEKSLRKRAVKKGEEKEETGNE